MIIYPEEVEVVLLNHKMVKSAHVYALAHELLIEIPIWE